MFTPKKTIPIPAFCPVDLLLAILLYKVRTINTDNLNFCILPGSASHDMADQRCCLLDLPKIRRTVNHIQNLRPNKKPVFQFPGGIHKCPSHRNGLRQFLKLLPGALQRSKVKYKDDHCHHTDHCIQDTPGPMPSYIDSNRINSLKNSPPFSFSFLLYAPVICSAEYNAGFRLPAFSVLFQNPYRRIWNSVQC